MGFEGSCPGCGGAVEFRFENSVTLICPHCESLVGRGGGALEDYGKVADLVQSDSPLRTGLSGMIKGRSFDITGRVQMKHAAGAIWSEWFVAFDSGEKWGWLAEAQGRYYLTFPKDLPQGADIPAFDEMTVAHKVRMPGHGKMTVVEKGQATVVSAEGEIPLSVRPGEVTRFVDLQGSAGKFVTLDQNDGSWDFFVGREFPLRRFGISDREEARESEAQIAESVAVNCPTCAGAIEVKDPQKAERYACVYCDSLLDCSQGNLKFISALKQKKAKPKIPLGTKGELRETSCTVIGFVRRSAEGFEWDEYLLRVPRQPYHWLIHSDDHWSFARPLMPGEVAASYEEAIYDEQRFKIYDRSKPVVKAVYGEFYWKVRLGERTRTWDYIRPPLMISREVAETERDPEPQGRVRSLKKPKGNRNDFDEGPRYRDRAAVGREYQLQSGIASANKHEVNFVLSEYVPASEIEEAFGVEDLPRSWSVGSLQPFPLSGVYVPAAIMVVVALLLGGLVRATQGTRNVGSGEVEVSGVGATSSVKDFDQGPFEIKSGSNLRVSFRLQSALANDWMMIRGNFYDESDKGFSHPKGSFAALATRANPTRKLISRLPTSRYTLRLRVESSSGQPPASSGNMPTGSLPRKLSFRVDQNVPSMGNLILLLVALVVPLMFVGIFNFVFESRRWQDTDKV